MKPLPIKLPSDDIADFCRRHNIARMALFGSVVRDDFNSESDVDILVEFLPGREPGYIRLAAMEDELSGMIGRRAEFNTPDSLSKYFIDEVIREARPIYVAA